MHSYLRSYFITWIPLCEDVFTVYFSTDLFFNLLNGMNRLNSGFLKNVFCNFCFKIIIV